MVTRYYIARVPCHAPGPRRGWSLDLTIADYDGRKFPSKEMRERAVRKLSRRLRAPLDLGPLDLVFLEAALQ